MAKKISELKASIREAFAELLEDYQELNKLESGQPHTSKIQRLKKQAKSFCDTREQRFEIDKLFTAKEQRVLETTENAAKKLSIWSGPKKKNSNKYETPKKKVAATKVEIKTKKLKLEDVAAMSGQEKLDTFGGDIRKLKKFVSANGVDINIRVKPEIYLENLDSYLREKFDLEPVTITDKNGSGEEE